MRIQSLSLLHLKIPFQTAFTHASHSRIHGDTLLVRIDGDNGASGWGEILARTYVTGETHESILATTAEIIARELIGKNLPTVEDFVAWANQTRTQWSDGLALFGGIELSLWNAFASMEKIDWSRWLGPQRRRSCGRCMTIDFGIPEKDMRRIAIAARLQNVSVIKMKVGQDASTDVERLNAISSAFGNKMPIRLDGNGAMDLDQAHHLLESVSQLPVQSLEEPLDRKMPDLVEALRSLHDRFGIVLMADESVCSNDDAVYWASTGAYQCFNVRVGKNGGLLGACQVRDVAIEAGLGTVAGSMVGESSCLAGAAQRLLDHSDTIDYVEGLGQHKTLLSVDPMNREIAASGEYQYFLDELETQPLIKSTLVFK